MNLRMITLLAIFVWGPMMAYLGWKYLQTFKTSNRGRRMRRRAHGVYEPMGNTSVVEHVSRRQLSQG